MRCHWNLESFCPFASFQLWRLGGTCKQNPKESLATGITVLSDYSVPLTVILACFEVYFVLCPRSERDYFFLLSGG